MLLIAHNIRSLHNVGSFFRSGEAFGIEKIYLTGYTGTPPRAEIHKTALGSENRIPWEQVEDVISLIHQLREKEGYKIYGLETGGISIENFFPVDSSRFVLLLGSEVEGISSDIRERLDGLIEIPMSGYKKSLNVSVATGIALFVLGQKT